MRPNLDSLKELIIMADFVKFHSDVNRTLNQYIDETSAALKEFETFPEEEQSKNFTATLYQVRLEQYYALIEIKNLLKIHFN